MANILIDTDSYLKICDFGFCEKMTKDETKNKFCGTLITMAPEMIKIKMIKDQTYKRTVDWWSIGIIIY